MKKIIACLLALTFLLGFCCCGESKPSQNKAAEARTFTDDAGREVELPVNIDRVIPSGGVAQIMLFSFAPEKLVGLASEFEESAKGIIPDKYYGLPYFGQFYGSADMNIEELAKAEPQLVIDIGDSKKNQTEDLNAFTAQTGIPIVYLYCDLAGTADTYRRLGELLNLSDRAEEYASWFSGVYERTIDIMEQVGEKKIRALYVQGDAGQYVLAKGSYHAEVLDLLTENAAVVDEVSNKGLGNEVSMEQIALWDPDFVIFKSGSIYGEVKEMNVWSQLTAIQTDSYVECPVIPHCWLGTPPSVQRYLALIWLPSVLYPEYADYDVSEELKTCFHFLYNTELTDAQLNALTGNAFLS